MAINFSTVWQSILQFVRSPQPRHLPETFEARPANVFPYLLAIDFLIMIPLSGLMGLAGVEDMDHAVMDMMDQPMLLIAFAVILAPLIEEAIFRLPIGLVFKNHFKPFFWIMTTLFALVHITNFTSGVAYYLIPLMVLPQFILGIMLGYIRTGWSYLAAVVFHALHNGILLGIALAATSIVPE